MNRTTLAAWGCAAIFCTGFWLALAALARLLLGLVPS
jgi:hypothetical protein